jgi:zinc/manganese transport system permease protein
MSRPAAVGLAVAECLQIVGVLLVFALMVGPAAAAQRLTTGIGSGVLLSVGLALLETWTGIAQAFYTDWPSSFWITALGAGIYLFTTLPGVGRARCPACSWRRQSSCFD